MIQSPNKIQKILIVTLSNLGDVILTLPVFQSLIENFPKAELHVLVSPSAADVFRGDARILRIIIYDKKITWREKWRYLKKIRGEHYDVIVDLRRSFFGILGGAKFKNSYIRFPCHKGHQAGKHLNALNNMIQPVDSKESFLRAPFLEETGLIENVSDETDKIVVAAVGSKSDIKKWPAEYYAGCLDRLAIDEKCRIILIGNKQDTEDAARVKELMRSNVLDLTGKTDFRALCSIIKSARLVITNDSAPLHIADALKVPTLAIFGPTDPQKYGPSFIDSRAAFRPVFCAPCQKAQCRFDHECMKELGVREVYQKAAQILNDETQPKNLKILVVRLDRIGDVVLSLAAVQAIRGRFPNASISMMVRPYTRALVEGHPALDEVIVYEYEKGGRHRSLLGNYRFLREIIKRHFDIAFILHPSNRSNNIPFLAGIPYRIGFKSRWPFLLTKGVPDKRQEGTKHESEYTLDVIRAFGIDEPVSPPYLPVTEYENLLVFKLLQDEQCRLDEKIIAFHPGASCKSKRWPLERFIELGKRIAAETPYRIAAVGSLEEKPSGDRLREALGSRVINLTGKLGLKTLAGFLKYCDILVSNDSGPVHIAAAVGTKTLTIFGRNQAGLSVTRWRALGERHAQIQKDVGCVVCLAHRCPIDFECLKAAEVKDVYDRVKSMLSIETQSSKHK